MRSFLVLLLFCLGLAGCMAVDFTPPEVLPAAPAGSTPTPLSYEVKLRGFEENRDGSGPFRAPLDQVHEVDLLAALESSGRFSTLAQGESTSGYSVKVNTFSRANNRNSSAVRDNISILTLTIIPMKTSIEFISDIELSKDGQVVDTWQVRELADAYLTITLPHAYLFGGTMRAWEQATAQKIANQIIRGVEMHERN